MASEGKGHGSLLNDEEINDLRRTIFEETDISIPKDDPIFLVLAFNRLMFDGYVGQISTALSNVLDQIDSPDNTTAPMLDKAQIGAVKLEIANLAKAVKSKDDSVAKKMAPLITDAVNRSDENIAKHVVFLKTLGIANIVMLAFVIVLVW